MTVNDALLLKDSQRTAAINEADKRRSELHTLVGEISEIDAALLAIPMCLLGGEDISTLRDESDALRKKRERMLEAAGFDKDYDEPRFSCPDCRDSGYRGARLCECVRRLVSETQYAESTLAKGLSGKTLDNFSLDYYSGNDRARAEKALSACKRYADAFPAQGISGLLLTGGTGLGKTHLSAAVGNIISSKGYSVVYESASALCDTLEAVRFNRAELSERKKYENASLLIIDDLGTENTTAFSTAAIGSLIDLRIVAAKQTVISTNLTFDALKKTYGERIFSRLMGEYRVLALSGCDIRMQKIKE